MKKNLIVTIIFGTISLLFACSSFSDNSSNYDVKDAATIGSNGNINSNESKVTSNRMIEDIKKENPFTFIGIIEEIHGNAALVLIEEGELTPGTQVGVNLSVAKDTIFEVGDRVKVGFDGTIRETYPYQINTTSVQLVK